MQYLGELGEEIVVYRNDEIDLDGIASWHRTISSSRRDLARRTKRASASRFSNDSKERFRFSAYAWAIKRSDKHSAETSFARISSCMARLRQITHDGKTIFEGLPVPFYGDAVPFPDRKRETLPDCLEISAETEDGLIMGLRHKEYVVEGVQFHPESIMTDNGLSHSA